MNAPILYPGAQAPDLDLALFRHPTAAYRGAPFWSWNTTLDRDHLLRQIDDLKRMGFGGFHIHSRTGLATDYLGDAFMGHVRACTEKAAAEGMLCWLYDEDRWPSGFAGGLVTRDERFRAKHLLVTPTPYNGTVDPPPLISNAKASRNENGVLLARYHVVLRDGYLASYRRLTDGEDAPTEGRVWYAYLETAVPSPWWNNQTYVDTLDRAAIERFIDITHERYAAVVGAHFGTLVPAIFTDEPQFVHKESLHHAEDAHDLFLPWTVDLFATYRTAYGQDLADHLPEVFWELPDGRASVVRYRYHDHLAERFAAAFADTIGAWCAEHRLGLTGHMMEEPTLLSQTHALGEAMRSYRAFHIPGIDMLCDRREYTTAKQAQSAAHQYGRPGVLSELYGVTNWDFDFVGHKAQGDWQAALGVTVRVPHLSWVSMAGEAKRDYPASIHYQSPWYKEYPLIEDHFARLTTVLTRGRPRVRVGVIHPVESYWLCFGPLDQTGVERDEREADFATLTRWLLFGLIDYDFIAESLLPDLCPLEDAAAPALPVGAMRYEAVVVPALRTIRATTLDRLERFADAGGTVIVAGSVPSLVDAEPSHRPSALAERCMRVALTRGALLAALAPFRDIEVRLADGEMSDALLHQVRDDGDHRRIFLCNTDRARPRADTRIALGGRWDITRLDTFDGSVHVLPTRHEGDRTVLRWSFPAHGDLLLSLRPVGRAGAREGQSPSRPGPATPPGWSTRSLLADPVPVTLSEPNVLLLDRASYRLNDEPWEPEEEVLRVDNLLRSRLGLPLKMDAIAQPWTEPRGVVPPNTVSLRFVVQSAIAIECPLLALEDVAGATIRVDGRPIANEATGWFVDEAIATIALPALAVGRHEIEVTRPYGRATNLEWCYLLGDFGVAVRGRHAAIVAPVRELAFGDWTTQGLPFYAGNVTYQCRLEGAERDMALRAPAYKAPLLSVALNGVPVGRIAFAPYRLDLGHVAAGAHALDITAYGNRVNAFGPVHNADPTWTWFGPDAWRTTGDQWAYEYQLKPMGILSAPRVEVAGGGATPQRSGLVADEPGAVGARAYAVVAMELSAEIEGGTEAHVLGDIADAAPGELQQARRLPQA